jgi:hypothetical protein
MTKESLHLINYEGGGKNVQNPRMPDLDKLVREGMIVTSHGSADYVDPTPVEIVEQTPVKPQPKQEQIRPIGY